MKYRFPLPPSSNRYWRYVRGRVVLSAAAAEYLSTVAILARIGGVEQLSGPVVVEVAIYRHHKRGDLDNFLKILLDALAGSFYSNDAQVSEIHAYLHDDRHDPRCEVAVTQLPFA